MNSTKPAVTSYTVELPLPYLECSRNTSCHWGSRGPVVKRYRQECMLAYRAAKLPAIAQISLSLEFYCGGRVKGANGKFNPDGLYRPMDIANAIDSFKAGQDALVDAGVVPNDSRKYVRQGPVTIHGTKQEHKGRCCVVLTITEI